jgi:ParB/RepB/Spo0J family partition protein
MSAPGTKIRPGAALALAQSMAPPEVTGACHPACSLLPELSADEFAALVEDIREHGQRHPIIVDEAGVILDGRNRWRACQQLGIDPQVCEFKGDDAAKLALILSENLHRRHLSKGQRAMAVAMLRPEAKIGRGSDEQKVATKLGLSRERLRQARAVLAWAEHAGQAVLTGEVALNDAYQQMLEARQLERPAPPSPPPPDEPEVSEDEVFGALRDAAPRYPKQALSAPQRMRHQWNAMQKAKSQEQDSSDPGFGLSEGEAQEVTRGLNEQAAAAPAYEKAPWLASADDLREQYVVACQHWPHERRVKELERVMWALGVPAKSWATVQLPKPEPGKSRWDDGCFIRQMEAWAAGMLDADRVSPSAVQMLGERLLSLGRSRIGVPASPVEPVPTDANVEDDEAALRVWACDRDTAFLARNTTVSTYRLDRFKSGGALGYDGRRQLRELRAQIGQDAPETTAGQ